MGRKRRWAAAGRMEQPLVASDEARSLSKVVCRSKTSFHLPFAHCLHFTHFIHIISLSVKITAGGLTNLISCSQLADELMTNLDSVLTVFVFVFLLLKAVILV
jgi:hypothetical protein